MTDLSARSALIEMRDVEVTYKRVIVALQGVSVSVDEGEIVAVLGPNGAGKTTMLRAVTGFLPNDNARITAGDVLFEGQRLNGRAPHTIAGLGVAIVPERDKVFRTLTVEENLRAVPLRGTRSSRSEMADFVFDLFPVLGTLHRRLAGYLSGGERQMLAVAKALMAEPRVLVTDEPSLGISPALVERMMTALMDINRSTGLTILLVEQNAVAALEIAHRAYILETGRTVLEGTPDELRADQTVRDFYLGLTQDVDHRRFGSGRRYRRKQRIYG